MQKRELIRIGQPIELAALVTSDCRRCQLSAPYPKNKATYYLSLHKYLCDIDLPSSSVLHSNVGLVAFKISCVDKPVS